MYNQNERDPRDLNGDGNVSFEEKVRAAADYVGKKIDEFADKASAAITEETKELRQEAKETIAEAKAFVGRGKEVYSDAAEKAKEAYNVARDSVFEAADKAKEKIKDFTGKD